MCASYGGVCGAGEKRRDNLETRQAGLELVQAMKEGAQKHMTYTIMGFY